MSDDIQIPQSHLARLWLYLVGGIVLALLIAPSVIIVLMSFSDASFLEFPPSSWSLRWYHAYLGSSEWRSATLVSLQVAILTTMIATPMATAAAYAIQAEEMIARRSLQTVITAALIIPVILLGIGTFLVYAHVGLNNTITGLVLAHTVQALPLALFPILAGFRTYDMNQEKVARSLGASRPIAFLKVTLPQIKLSIFTGALLAFITSFDEVVVSLFISGGDTATLTRRMFNALRDQIDPTIAAISTLLIILSVLLLSIAQIVGRQREPTK